MYQKYVRLLGKRTTYASDIDGVGRQHFGQRWGGVLARDNMPPPGHMRVFVVNTDESTGRGVHWIAAMDVQGKRYFNDSLGMAGASQRRQLERLHPNATWAELDALLRIPCETLMEEMLTGQADGTNADYDRPWPRVNRRIAEKLTIAAGGKRRRV